MIGDGPSLLLSREVAEPCRHTGPPSGLRQNLGREARQGALACASPSVVPGPSAPMLPGETHSPGPARKMID